MYKKRNRTEFVDLKFLYNFYYRHFYVGHVSTITKPFEKEVQSFHEVKS
jgi:hypothetical protein